MTGVRADSPDQKCASEREKPRSAWPDVVAALALPVMVIVIGVFWAWSWGLFRR